MRQLGLAVAFVAACTFEPYREPIEGPVSLGGRTAIVVRKPLRTPGLKRQLCLALPAGFAVDLQSCEIVAPNGQRGALAARMRSDDGNWYTLHVSSRAGEHVCLSSPEILGRMGSSFVEVEVTSDLSWVSTGGYWISGEKL